MLLKMYNFNFAILISVLVGILNCQDTDDLVFLAVGDWGDSFYWDPESPQMVVAGAMNEWAGANSPRFILSTGDNFYPKGVRSPNDAFFEQKWKRVYTGEHIRDLQWRLSLGNHDYNDEDRAGPNAGGNEIFQLARAEQDPQWYLPYLWYKFTEPSPAGDVDFFVVDTMAIDAKFNYYTEQYEWLERELNASTAAIKLVVGHHNVWTVGNYAPSIDSLHDVLEPLMLQYGVFSYISGHDHSMSYLWYTNGTGHDYIITAGGGREVNRKSQFWSDWLEENQGIENIYYMSHGFTGIYISEDTFRADMYDENGDLLFDIIRPIP